MMGSIRGTVFSLGWHSAVPYSETGDNEDELAFGNTLALATPWRRLCLAAFGLSLVVAVLRGSVGTSHMYIVVYRRI